MKYRENRKLVRNRQRKRNQHIHRKAKEREDKYTGKGNVQRNIQSKEMGIGMKREVDIENEIESKSEGERGIERYKERHIR